MFAIIKAACDQPPCARVSPLSLREDRKMRGWEREWGCLPVRTNMFRHFSVPHQISQPLSPLLQSSRHSWTPVFFSSDCQLMTASSWRAMALCDLWSGPQEEQSHWESKKQICAALPYLLLTGKCKPQHHWIIWFNITKIWKMTILKVCLMLYRITVYNSADFIFLEMDHVNLLSIY